MAMREKVAQVAFDWFGWQPAKRDHRAVDVWQLGVTLLYMLCPCNQMPHLEHLLQELKGWRWWWQRRVQLPAWVPPELSDLLLECMLVRRPKSRWSIQQLKSHSFFAGVDWAAVEARRVPLPVGLVALAAGGQRAMQAWRAAKEAK